jgi:hypothetical protein
MNYNIIQETGNGTSIAATTGSQFAALKQAAELALDNARRFRPDIAVTMAHDIGANLCQDAIDLWNRVVEDDWSLPSVSVKPATESLPFSVRGSD